MSGPLETSLKLGSIKTAFPLVAAGLYCLWKVSEVKTEETDLDSAKQFIGVVPGVDTLQPLTGKGQVLRITYKLQKLTKDTDGKDLNPDAPGSSFFDSINLYADVTGKDKTWYLKRIAERVDSLLGTLEEGNEKGKPVRPNLDVASPTFGADLANLIMGTELIAQMSVETFKEVTRNHFKKTYFPGDLPAGTV